MLSQLGYWRVDVVESKVNFNLASYFFLTFNWNGRWFFRYLAKESGLVCLTAKLSKGTCLKRPMTEQQNGVNMLLD